MKKIIFLVITLMIAFITISSYAYLDTIELDFEVVKNEENKEFDLYLLLPEEYIKFAISDNVVDVKYDGVNTLKDNYISGIDVEKENIQDEMYEEEGIKYIQILLEPDRKGVFEFDLLKDYPKLNIKYRIKNEKKDYIVHIDNFKIENGICKIEYNYDENTVKQPDKIMTNNIILLIIILIIVIIIGIIAYSKKGDN